MAGDRDAPRLAATPKLNAAFARLSGVACDRRCANRSNPAGVANFDSDAQAWRRVYNTLRPHESLDDAPPVTRWSISPRRRPDVLPAMEYPPGVVLRKVSKMGDVHYRQTRILIGQALARQFVRVEEREHEIALYYGPQLVRVIGNEQLTGRRTYKRV